jgi:predicted secreted acid phosphatase
MTRSRFLRRASATAVIAAAIWTAACVTGSSPGHVENLYDVERQIDRYVVSGDYDRDVARVVATAQAYLERRAGAAQKPAIVLDIDETSLSNWPAYRANGWGRVLNGGCNLKDGPCGLRAYQELGEAQALKPTLALATKAKALGVAVFFVTGRPASLREATERNLKERGYQWDELFLMPPGRSFTSAADFKAPARKAIVDRGYTILLNMGDQESDLRGGYAEKTFKLPNPVYYLP